MPTPLRIDIHRSSGLTVLEAVGELDVSSAPELLARARSVLSDVQDGDVVVDLRGVPFMDSTGLRALLFAEEACRQAGRPFSVVRGGGQVQRLMAVTRTVERLHVRDDLEVSGA